MKAKFYINTSLRNLGLGWILFIVANLINPDIYHVKFAQLLAILTVAVTCYDIFICQLSMGKVLKSILRSFGCFAIGLLILVLFYHPTSNRILSLILTFAAYAVIFFVFLIIMEIIQKKRIEKINKKLKELNGDVNVQ